MRHLLRAASIAAAISCVVFSTVGPHAQPFVADWSRAIGGPLDDSGVAVVLDPTENIVVVGRFMGSVDFGAGPLTSAGATDVFIAKYNADGLPLWSRAFGGAASDAGTDVACDAGGNIVVIGRFSGTVDFGGGPFTTSEPRIFLASYDAGGSHRWSRSFGGWGNAVAVGPGGSVAITGGFRGTVDFGGAPLTSATTALFVAVFEGDGLHRWSVQSGSAELLRDGDDIVLDSSDAVYVGGGQLRESTITISAWVWKFNSSGTLVWSRPNPSGDLEPQVRAVAVDPAGFVIGGGYYGYLVKYSSSGARVWEKYIGPWPIESVAITAGGRIVAGGNFAQSFTLGGDAFVADGYDILVAEFDADGSYRRGRAYTGVNDQSLNGFVLDADGDAIVTGSFESSVDFGRGPITSAGGTDVFLTRILLDHPASIESILDVPGDQGRYVEITFPRHDYDRAGARRPIFQYEVLRDDGAWTLAGTVAAARQAIYQIVVPTLADSTRTAGMYVSTYMLRAVTADPLVLFDSPPAAGYSLDNLAPGAPESPAVNAGVLTWTPGPETDVDHFSVYRSLSGVFDASAAFIQSTTASSLDVGNIITKYYFVTASDRAGNEGPPARADHPGDAVPPGMPDGFIYAPGVLSWNANPEPDFDRYVVYGSTIDVMDTTATELGGTAETTFDIRTALFPYYYVAAVDLWNNVSAAARAHDDVAPAAPTNLKAWVWVISWSASPAPDVDHYVLYGSESVVFDDSRARIVETSGTSWNVESSLYKAYYVIAVDIAGNESAPARVIADWSAPAPQRYGFSLASYPNPFNPETVIRYEIPSNNHVLIRVYDARGTRIATLVDEERPAGVYNVPWTGRDDRGSPSGTGVYFIRLDSGGATKTHKTVLLK